MKMRRATSHAAELIKYDVVTNVKKERVKQACLHGLAYSQEPYILYRRIILTTFALAVTECGVNSLLKF